MPLPTWIRALRGTQNARPEGRAQNPNAMSGRGAVIGSRAVSHDRSTGFCIFNSHDHGGLSCTVALSQDRLLGIGLEGHGHGLGHRKFWPVLATFP